MPFLLEKSGCPNPAADDMAGRNGTRFKGWAYVVAVTDPPHLRQMLQDPDVLAIDGTATLIYDELTPETLRKASARIVNIYDFT